ncbi:MAG: O-methyltransferase [Ignavibacteria bacterium]|nr:MAG: O-methyltransferase [Ignavibacteria bacterium]KAF0161313.1 MAG: O-methyltransferase [Ignavibacteria bacterium]
MKRIVLQTQEKYLEKMRAKQEDLTLKMEAYAQDNLVPILNWNAADFLEVMIRAYKPKRVLEIGMAIGYSSIRIARQLKAKSVLHAIEKSNANIKLAAQYINKAGLDDKIKIFQGDALEIIPDLKKKYDFIFLDADKQDYEKLFNLLLPILKKNGIIFIDNLLWHGYAAARKVPAKENKSAQVIRSFNKLFMNSPLVKSIIIPVGDGIGIGVKVKNDC